MKSSNTSDVATGSGWNGWNARRSYNLLRLSLGHPMKYPLIEVDDTDEDMEVDDDLADDVSSLSQPTGMELGSTNIENLTKGLMGRASNGDLEAECTLSSLSSARLEDADADDTPNIESPTFGLLEIAKSTPPALEVPAPVLDATLGLSSPTHSYSPKAEDGNMECKNVLPFGLNSLAENEDVVQFGVTVIPVDGKAGAPSLRSSRSFTSPSPRDRLAASLQKGLQILDNHQKSSLATLRRYILILICFFSRIAPHLCSLIIGNGIDDVASICCAKLTCFLPLQVDQCTIFIPEFGYEEF
jgi:kinesin family protein 15